MSQVCAEFQIPPVEGGAVDQPIFLTNAIMRLRSYHTAWQMVNSSNPSQEIPEAASALWLTVKEAREYEDAQRAAEAAALTEQWQERAG